MLGILYQLLSLSDSQLELSVLMYGHTVRRYTITLPAVVCAALVYTTVYTKYTILYTMK